MTSSANEFPDAPPPRARLLDARLHLLDRQLSAGTPPFCAPIRHQLRATRWIKVRDVQNRLRLIGVRDARGRRAAAADPYTLYSSPTSSLNRLRSRCQGSPNSA
jgi:hypothetical protein